MFSAQNEGRKERKKEHRNAPDYGSRPRDTDCILARKRHSIPQALSIVSFCKPFRMRPSYIVGLSEQRYKVKSEGV